MVNYKHFLWNSDNHMSVSIWSLMSLLLIMSETHVYQTGNIILFIFLADQNVLI